MAFYDRPRNEAEMHVLVHEVHTGVVYELRGHGSLNLDLRDRHEWTADLRVQGTMVGVYAGRPLATLSPMPESKED